MNVLSIITQSNRVGLCFAVTLIVLLSSCVSKTPFLTSSVIPAARGYITVKQDDNENYNIQLSLKYLAEAERLTPPKSIYVIWMESERNSTKNIGHIKTAGKSNNLKASFETSSSYKPTRIFITAEDDGTASYPGENVVLTTGVIKG